MDKKMQLEGYFILFLHSNPLLEHFYFPNNKMISYLMIQTK
jgi:hypothetical protein